MAQLVYTPLWFDVPSDDDEKEPDEGSVVTVHNVEEPLVIGPTLQGCRNKRIVREYLGRFRVPSTPLARARRRDPPPAPSRPPRRSRRVGKPRLVYDPTLGSGVLPRVVKRRAPRRRVVSVPPTPEQLTVQLRTDGARVVKIGGRTSHQRVEVSF